MSLSLNPLPVRKGPVRKGPLDLRHAWRLLAAVALAGVAFLSPDLATAAPPEVRTPEEVRTTPAQFIGGQKIHVCLNAGVANRGLFSRTNLRRVRRQT